MTKAIGSILVLAAGLLALTCDSGVGRDLADVAVGILDGSDAKAQTGGGTTVSADCDLVRTETTTYSSGMVVTSTTWYVDLEMPGLSPSGGHVTVTKCDTECFGTSCDPPTCPVDATCSAEGYTPPDLPCVTFTYAWLGDERLVVSCGSRSQVDSPSGPDSDSGERYRTVHVRVD